MTDESVVAELQAAEAANDMRAAMLAHRGQVLTQHPEVKLARNLGPLMGEHEREYWIWTVETMERVISHLRGPRYTEIREAS